MLPPEEVSSEMTSMEMSSRPSGATLSVHSGSAQTPLPRGAEADFGQKSPKLDMADVEMADTTTAQAVSPRASGITTMLPVAAVNTMSATSTKYNRSQTATSCQKTKSSTSIPSNPLSARSMPAMQEPLNASHLTSPLKIPADLATPFDRAITKHTPNCMAHMTPGATSSMAHEVSSDNMQPPGCGNLHKRRASRSPDKFSGARMSPPKITTGLKDGSVSSPTPRGRTENKVEIYYDSTGALHVGTPLKADPSINPAVFPVSTTIDQNQRGGTRNTEQQLNHKHIVRGRKKVFSLLESFVRDNSLLITLTSYLDVPSIISLYAISKSFHVSFNRHATAFILSSMRTWAPGADIIFPWRCYRTLCIGDPIMRLKAVPKAFEADIDRLGDISRDVPSLRWLQMVVWREAISADMLMQLNSKALRLPRGTHEAIKRMWFALDLPLSAHRLAVFRNKTYFSNKSIQNATHFLIKCDMAFTDPGIEPFPLNHPNQALFPNQWAFGGAVGCNLREKLVAERNFTSLWRVLRGLTWDMDETSRPIGHADIMKLNVKHSFRWQDGTPEAVLKVPIMGMSYSDFKFTGCERTYREDDNEATKLMRPCRPLVPLHTLLMGESTRRDMHLEMQFLDMISWGFTIPGYRNVPLTTVEEQRVFMRKFGTRRPVVKARLDTKLSDVKALVKNMGETDSGTRELDME